MSKLGWFHMIAAIAAMFSGAIVVLRKKGTRPHRFTGWVYVASMYALNVSALMIYRLFGYFGPFHVAALFSLASVTAGMYFVIVRPNKLWLTSHYYFMSWSYVGLLAAAASEIGTRVEAFQFWWAVLIATALVIGVGAFLIKRLERPTIAKFGRLATERIPRRPRFLHNA